MSPQRWRLPSDAYGGAAVARNAVLFFVPLAAAPALDTVSPLVPWLLAPLVGLAAYRMTIVMHDCIHRTLFADTRLNLRVGRVLGFITGIDFYCFATQHLLHHRTYGQPDDPQGFHYLGLRRMSRREFAWHVLKPLLGFNLRYALQETLLNPANLRRARRVDLAAFAALQALVLAIVTGAGACWWLAPLPFIASATFGLFFSQLRGIAEHAALGEVEEPENVRSHTSRWLERLLLYDLNFNYHAEHHRHPQYPSCRLAAVHRALYAARAPLEHSMLRTIGSIPRSIPRA